MSRFARLVQLLTVAGLLIPSFANLTAWAGNRLAERPAVTLPTLGPMINSVDTVVSDMSGKNDLVLVGVPAHYGWVRGPGYVIMGNDPRGTRTPAWWKPANQRLKSDAYWNAIIPWFVIFDGEGHDASNTRVQVRNLRIFIKSRQSGEWRQIASSTGASGKHYPKHLQGAHAGAPDVRVERDGSTSIKPPGGDLLFHGWCCGKTAIDGRDVGAVFVTLQARLVLDRSSAKDDRSKARYLVHVGADYYPDKATSVADFAPTGYNPGIGLSRAKLVLDEWQAFNFATIDAGKQDTPGAAIRVSEFRISPPPLE